MSDFQFAMIIVTLLIQLVVMIFILTIMTEHLSYIKTKLKNWKH